MNMTNIAADDMATYQSIGYTWLSTDIIVCHYLAVNTLQHT